MTSCFRCVKSCKILFISYGKDHHTAVALPGQERHSPESCVPHHSPCSLARFFRHFFSTSGSRRVARINATAKHTALALTSCHAKDQTKHSVSFGPSKWAQWAKTCEDDFRRKTHDREPAINHLKMRRSRNVMQTFSDRGNVQFGFICPVQWLKKAEAHSTKSPRPRP